MYLPQLSPWEKSMCWITWFSLPHLTGAREDSFNSQVRCTSNCGPWMTVWASLGEFTEMQGISAFSGLFLFWGGRAPSVGLQWSGLFFGCCSRIAHGYTSAPSLSSRQLCIPRCYVSEPNPVGGLPGHAGVSPVMVNCSSRETSGCAYKDSP